MSETNQRSVASAGSVAGRITAYLASGGLFNPEQAIHDRVRDLLIDCRDEIERRRLTDGEREAIAWAVAAAEDRQHPADDALRGLLERTK
jgi:hypothetical protein